MDLEPNKRTAFVLGAGGGLGGARTLAREGAAVAMPDIDAVAAQRTVVDIEAAGGKALALRVRSHPAVLRKQDLASVTQVGQHDR